MKRILSVTWFALRALYDELFPLAGMGLIWFVTVVLIPYGVFYLASLTSIPALIVVAVLISLIPAPPMTGAIYHVAIQIAREKRIEFSYLLHGFKSYFGLSWKVGGIILISGAILIIDVVFYMSSDNTVFSVIGFLGLWALLFWLAIQVYLFPLTFLQEDTRLKVLLKNASLLTLAYPVFALGILVVSALITALSVLLVLILLATVWMPFIAILNARATVSSLEEVESFRVRQVEIAEDLEVEEK